ncbi:MAG: hypothetical protein LUD01_08485, partial [Clostridiales bacterium]|nr:hypothetical protein [Clostridiales bacterium]
MKIMRKAAAILLAGVLVMGTAVTAFADSPSTSSNKVATITATSSASKITATSAVIKSTGSAATVTVSDNDSAVAAELTDGSTTALDEAGVDSSDKVFMAVKTVTVDGAKTGDIVSVTLSVPGATAGSTVTVLYFDSEEGVWKEAAAEVQEDGTVTIEYEYTKGGNAIAI